MQCISKQRPVTKLVMAALCLLVIALFSPPLQAVGVDQLQLKDPLQEAQARDLFKKYRCLVCQNQSIEDSDAELAIDLRAIIREQIAAGKSPEEIEVFLVSRYGDWVLLTPRFSGLTILLWVFPFFLLGIGLIVIFIAFTRRRPETSSEETTTISEGDKKAIEQFRK